MTGILNILVGDNGSAAAWSPASLGSALKAWYIADTQVYKDFGTTPASNTDTVEQWNDQSGNGYHLVQGTVGMRPQFLSAGFNGKKTVQFSASGQTRMATQDGLSFSADVVAFGTGSSGSAFMVGQMLTGTSNFGCAIAYFGNGRWSAGDFASSGAHCASFLNRNGTSNAIESDQNNVVVSENISLATNYRLGSIFDGVNSTIYINNVAGTPGASVPVWTSPGTLSIGTLNSQGNLWWDGPISEIVVTNTALSSTDRNNLDSYFTTKWGL